MATSVNDPRITAAINTAMAAMYGKRGTSGGDFVWKAVYPAFLGQAWCGAFQVWGFRQAGVDLIACAWWFYVPYVVNFAKKIGAWKTTGNQYGDQPCYAWSTGALAAHVGASNPDPASNLFRAIEGNTSPTAAGSQGNGNGVWEKYRSRSTILGWVDMRVVLAWMIDNGKWKPGAAPVTTVQSTAGGKALTSTDKQYVLDQDGDRRAATNARWQQVMGTPIDGHIDNPSPAVKQFQTWLGKVVSAKAIEVLRPKGTTGKFVDGYLGAWTWKVFQYWFANVRPTDMKNICGFTIKSNPTRFWAEWCDGVEGAWTTTALQFCLNHSWANSGKLLAK